MSAVSAGGPFFDDLERGQVFDTAPALRLTEGRAAAHQAILGDRLRLPLDDRLAREVTGGAVVSPSLVWNVAIGQSTLATQRVLANLFYRRLALLRQPALGDTLHTVTTVVGLRENSRREGRAPTGLAALHIETRDQDDRPVLDFHRCAMLPLRSSSSTGHADDLTTVGSDGAPPDAGAGVAGWDHAAWTRQVQGDDVPAAGTVIEVGGGDVVSSAPELARLTLNVAAVHHDATAGGGTRLVYGGHTIGLALAAVTRALPDVATVLRWASCDHTGPVREGDTLRSRVTVGERRPVDGGWSELDLRVEVAADAGAAAEPRPVLDWRFTVLVG